MRYWRGNSISNETGNWRYSDGILVAEDKERKCGSCDLEQTQEGHDGCLGTLGRGVVNACCGHGERATAYVQFESGVILRGINAIEMFRAHQS